MPRRREYKPLLFTTTLRNPERMKDFLKILSPYNNQILTNDLIMHIVRDLISNKLYVPNYVRTTPALREKLNYDDVVFSSTETETIIQNSPQRHKEAGFDAGWPSRFDTWYKFFKELGFVYYKINQPIKISESGFKLIDAAEEQYRSYEKQVFLNAFVKYQRINPYVRVLNNNKPLILLLQVIKTLRQNNPNNAGVSIRELPLLICWKDDNFNALAEKIINIRNTYGFTPSREVIYEECKNILGIGHEDERRFKISNITGEMPDEFVRKMRLTGLFSIRGLGRFIDINNDETQKINYILDNYTNIQDFGEDELRYFDYMSEIDQNFVMETGTQATPDTKRQQFLHFVSLFENNVVEAELSVLTNRHNQSRHDMLKFIDEPLRFEFLVALLLQKKFNNIVVQPNYGTDDEGVPTSFAPGNNPDIICKDTDGNVLFEVSLVRGTQQVNREMLSISRHLKDTLMTVENAFSVFVSPTIHEDTLTYIDFLKYRDDIDIVALDIPQLIASVRQANRIWDIKPHN